MANGPVLVMGDSIMAWNRTSGASVGDALERRLGREVENVSVPGARVSGRGLGFLLRIGGQYRPGDWEWVVLNGGANDLVRDCACRRCDAVLDRLIAPDGRRGEIATLAARLLGTGAGVIYVGHYGPSGRGGPFGEDRRSRGGGDRNGGSTLNPYPGLFSAGFTWSDSLTLR